MEQKVEAIIDYKLKYFTWTLYYQCYTIFFNLSRDPTCAYIIRQNIIDLSKFILCKTTAFENIRFRRCCKYRVIHAPERLYAKQTKTEVFRLDVIFSAR